MVGIDDDIYRCQSSIDLQFFMEELFNNSFEGKREDFIKEMKIYVKRYAEEISKITYLKMKSELCSSIRNKFENVMTEIDEENSISKLENMIFESDKNEKNKEIIDKIFT